MRPGCSDSAYCIVCVHYAYAGSRVPKQVCSTNGCHNSHRPGKTLNFHFSSLLPVDDVDDSLLVDDLELVSEVAVVEMEFVLNFFFFSLVFEGLTGTVDTLEMVADDGDVSDLVRSVDFLNISRSDSCADDSGVWVERNVGKRIMVGEGAAGRKLEYMDIFAGPCCMQEHCRYRSRI
jgi:hypothetical protein